MTSKADFTEQEWDAVLEGPPSAGMIVVTASRGGTFERPSRSGRRTRRLASSTAPASCSTRSCRPSRRSITRVTGRPRSCREHAVQHIRDAIEVLERKASADEVEGYRRFVLGLAERVASAHREDGMEVSGPEHEAIEQIRTSLGSSGDVTPAE